MTSHSFSECEICTLQVDNVLNSSYKTSEEVEAVSFLPWISDEKMFRSQLKVAFWYFESVNSLWFWAWNGNQWFCILDTFNYVVLFQVGSVLGYHAVYYRSSDIPNSDSQNGQKVLCSIH